MPIVTIPVRRLLRSALDGPVDSRSGAVMAARTPTPAIITSAGATTVKVFSGSRVKRRTACCKRLTAVITGEMPLINRSSI